MSGSLDHAQCEIIRKLLIDLGQAANSQTVDWSIFSYTEPNTPDNCITVYNTTGTTQGSFQTSGEVQEFHGIQIRLRGNNKKTAFAKANDIFVALSGVQMRTVTVESSAYTVASVRPTANVIDLGNETPDSKRRIFTINAITALHQT